MKNFIDAVPVEMEESASMEGAGTLQTLARVVLPLALPGLAVTAIYTFINAWGAFVVPLVLNGNPDDQPGPITIFHFLGSHGVFKTGELAAYSLMFSVPVVVLYLVMSRHFSGAFTFGGGVRG
jgi:multiple sugar transport system permease protein